MKRHQPPPTKRSRLRLPEAASKIRQPSSSEFHNRCNRTPPGVFRALRRGSPVKGCTCHTVMRVTRQLLIVLAVLCASAFADDPENWKRPFPPFQVVGNLYYVGTED